MRPVTIAFASALLVCLLTHTAAAVPEQLETYKLPDDATQPVIGLDYRGGMIARVDEAPSLVIQADGTTHLNAPYGMRKKIETKIPAQQLQDLLRMILHDYKFEQIDPRAIQQAIQQKGQMFAIMDAATVVVRVNIPDHQHEVKYYALRMMAQRFPDIEPLHRLAAIELRLSLFMSRIHAGGDEGLKKHLALANDALKKDHPEVKPLLTAHLEHAQQLADGRQTISFKREQRLDPEMVQVTHVSLRYPAEGDVAIRTSVTKVKRPADPPKQEPNPGGPLVPVQPLPG
jgi:hypothetical protein